MTMKTTKEKQLQKVMKKKTMMMMTKKKEKKKNKCLTIYFCIHSTYDTYFCKQLVVLKD